MEQHQCDLKTLRDEIINSFRPIEQLFKIMITSGRDKARGNLEGTARTESFRTILFSTGESPSLDATNDGGLRGRLIDLWGNPFLRTDNETKSIVDKINWTIQDHYGHGKS